MMWLLLKIKIFSENCKNYTVNKMTLVTLMLLYFISKYKGCKKPNSWNLINAKKPENLNKKSNVLYSLYILSNKI